MSDSAYILVYVLVSFMVGIPIVRYWMGNQFQALDRCGDLDGVFLYLYYAFISVLILPCIPFYIIGLGLRWYGRKAHGFIKDKL